MGFQVLRQWRRRDLTRDLLLQNTGVLVTAGASAPALPGTVACPCQERQLDIQPWINVDHLQGCREWAGGTGLEPVTSCL
jgi:hypothetical protein